ncbi:MAG: hypothetical protein IT260_05345 [Saprospiraceae bacterium]|nr:hypothetical protein [Saprospiraceae bacterium]
MTFNFPWRIPSLCLLFLLFRSPLFAQALPPVTPANAGAVVQALQARMGTEISISTTQIHAFFTSFLANYQSSVPAPAAHADSGGLQRVDFSWKPVPTATEYTAAWLDLRDGSSFITTTPVAKYSFNDLNSEHLYLFVFATRKGEFSSALKVTAGKAGFIIIDDKIFFTGKECSFFSSLAGGSNQVAIPLLPGQSRTLRIRVDPCLQFPTITLPDAFFLRVENPNGASLEGRFFTNSPLNQNNAISGVNSINFPGVNNANLMFLANNAAIVTSFTIVNTTPNLCAFLSVEECQTGRNDDPESPVLDAAWQISPNPATERVAVQLGLPLPEAGQWWLCNAMGQVLAEQTLEAGVSDFSLELGHLPAGLYRLGLRSAAWTGSTIIVKK